MIKLPTTPTLYVPMISDYGFKITFGNEENTLFLERSLKALIGSPHDITIVNFEKHTIDGLTDSSKAGIFDVHCKDATGTHFIVEMQLDSRAEFVQRMKFYAFYRLNTMVVQGSVRFENLPKLYCIAFWGKNFFSSPSYHHFIALRTTEGELFDTQMTFIIVELDKFVKKPEEIQSDLDKLLYTMLNLHQQTEGSQAPEFWGEEWIGNAIREAYSRNFTPEQYATYMIHLAKEAEVYWKAKKEEQDRIEMEQKIAAMEQERIEMVEQKIEIGEKYIKVVKQKIEMEEKKMEMEKERIEMEKARIEMEKSIVEMEKTRFEMEKSRIAMEERNAVMDESMQKLNQLIKSVDRDESNR